MKDIDVTLRSLIALNLLNYIHVPSGKQRRLRAAPRVNDLQWITALNFNHLALGHTSLLSPMLLWLLTSKFVEDDSDAAGVETDPLAYPHAGVVEIQIGISASELSSVAKWSSDKNDKLFSPLEWKIPPILKLFLSVGLKA